MAATFTPRISTGATFTWNSTSITKMVDISVSGSAPAVDITAQDTSGNREFLAGFREVTFTMSLIWDQQDTNQGALYTDFAAGIARTAVITMPDGTAYNFTGAIENLSHPMALGDAIKADITIIVSDQTTLTPL